MGARIGKPLTERAKLLLDYLPRASSLSDAQDMARADGHDMPCQTRWMTDAFRNAGLDTPGQYLRKTVPQPAEHSGRDFAALRDAIKRCDGTIHGLCDVLDCGPTKARALIADAQRHGLACELTDDKVAIEHPRPRTDPQHIPSTSRKLKLGVISDTHAGSKYARYDVLRRFVLDAYERGVRHMLHVGDICDGTHQMHRGMVHEQDAIGIYAQVEAALDALPQLDGLRYHVITGNHDVTFLKQDAACVGRTLLAVANERGRDDISYLGYAKARCFIGGEAEGDGLAIDLLHPRGAPAYSLSYKLQKFVESYVPGNKPQILLVGHYHQYCAINQRRVHAFMVPAFQDQTPYLVEKSLHPTIGGVILDVECADDWSINALSHTVIEYPGRGYEVAA